MPRLVLFRLQGAAFKTSGIEFSFRSSANHILVFSTVGALVVVTV